jgi:hypothetical protein
MAAKRLNTTTVTPAAIKAAADIPAQIYMTTGTGYVDCINISLNAVKILVNAPNYFLYDICTMDGTFVQGGESGKINAWARYKPGVTTYNTKIPADYKTNPTFTYTKPSEGSLGSFAGYNHTEDTRPTYWGTPPDASYTGVYQDLVTQTYYCGLAKGMLGPLLDSNENAEYLDRIQIYVYVKEGSSLYSDFWLPSATPADYYQWDNIGVWEMGAHGETPGNTYTVYIQPFYFDSNDDVEAACECGFASFTYECKSFDQFLIDYHFQASSDMSAQDVGGVNKIYCASGSGITLNNNGHGYTPHWHDSISADYRLKITDLDPGTGGTMYQTIGTLVIPTDSSIAWNISGDYIDVESYLGHLTEAEVVIQCCKDGINWYDWQSFGSFYW